MEVFKRRVSLMF